MSAPAALSSSSRSLDESPSGYASAQGSGDDDGMEAPPLAPLGSKDTLRAPSPPLSTAPTDGLSSTASSSYRFFEDHYPTPPPAPTYSTYEDQMLGGQVTNCDVTPTLTESERLHKLFDWDDSKPAEGVKIPGNFGWSSEWGPEPGEAGHYEWYNKPRQYMSNEEKVKYDAGMMRPLPKGALRHQELPYNEKLASSFNNLVEDKPDFIRLSDKGRDASYSLTDKRDYMGQAKEEFINEWLSKPGVEPSNLGKKIADYNGTAKRQRVIKAPRKPEWEMSPLPDE